MRPIHLVVFFLTALSYFEASAQNDSLWVSGRVLDSLTRLAIPFVAIANHPKGLGAFTDDRGDFTIKASVGDTLTITIVGYMPKQRVITDHDDILVLLNENPQLLKPITVYGSFKPQGQSQWAKAITLPKMFRNPAGPGSGYAIETFGPGIVLNGVFSMFSKSEKEKKKLKRDREDLSATQLYRNTITDPEVKTFIMKTFSLTETEYNKKIEQFNKTWPEASHVKTKDEIMTMLVNFFAQKKE